jgi:hypothetical protein
VRQQAQEESDQLKLSQEQLKEKHAQILFDLKLTHNQARHDLTQSLNQAHQREL